MVHDLRVLLRLSEGRAPDPWATKLDCCTLQGTLVEFRSGDTRELDVPDGEFDAVVAHTLVNHVQEALTVLNEAARVVKPGGLITIFVGGLRIDDVRPGRSAREQNVWRSPDQRSRNKPPVMRQMPHLIQQAGLEMVRTFLYKMAEVGEGDI
jgi:ubiquinone/menaquinone biosynthesis C-methylase UbiE